MFLGTYRPRLDDKGRLILPAKFRDGLAEGLVMTKGQDRCLWVFSTDEFARVTEALRNAPPTRPEVRAYARVMFSAAADEVPDRQGRVTIPPSLREYAGLDRECAVVGMHSRVEIWAADAWSRYLEQTEPAFAELSEEVLPGVF